MKRKKLLGSLALGFGILGLLFKLVQPLVLVYGGYKMPYFFEAFTWGAPIGLLILGLVLLVQDQGPMQDHE